MPPLIALVCGLVLAAEAGAGDVPNIAAAADLKFVLPAIAAEFEKDSGSRVSLSFGSSGIFRRQIAQGAPFELFLSADESHVEALQREQRSEGAGALYAIGRIVLFLPAGSPIRADPELRDLRAAAGDGRLVHLALSNPQHAPYGRAAMQALQHLGLWQAVQGRLALGENTSQSARFAASGACQAALLPYSLALAPELASKGSYVMLPESWHQPLRQRMVLIKGAGNTARRFYEFLQQPKARAILERQGFALPQVSR